MILRDHRDVTAYREDFDRYEEHALFGDECRTLLAEWSAAFTRPHQ
ncbi:hypothetical protein OG580_23385 [Streptomyces sp. NBC_00094]|nr:hypothetical protein [Streptomyces sp. NBC_00094]